jgi:hypothetical protein
MLADFIKFDEMYAVPESFLEIEVRNPLTHGECLVYHVDASADKSRSGEEDVYRL